MGFIKKKDPCAVTISAQGSLAIGLTTGGNKFRYRTASVPHG